MGSYADVNTPYTDSSGLDVALEKLTKNSNGFTTITRF